MNFEEMCSLTMEQLRKKTKAQLLSAIEGKYSYICAKSSVERLERELSVAKAPATELKKLICGVIGKLPPPTNDYDQTPDYNKEDLSGLVGDLIAKYNELLVK